MKIVKVPIELSLMSYFDEAHSSLVMAAEVAHFEKHPEAQNISELIDTLEEIILKVCDETSLTQKT
jgi:hypothetical protein